MAATEPAGAAWEGCVFSPCTMLEFYILMHGDMQVFDQETTSYLSLFIYQAHIM